MINELLLLICLLHNNFSESTNFNNFFYIKFNCTNCFNIFINDILSSSFKYFNEFHHYFLEDRFINTIFSENYCLNLLIKSLSNLSSNFFIENGFSYIQISLLLFSGSKQIPIFRNKTGLFKHTRRFFRFISNLIQRENIRTFKIYSRLKKKLFVYKDLLKKIFLISVFVTLTFSSKIVLMNSDYSSIFCFNHDFSDQMAGTLNDQQGQIYLQRKSYKNDYIYTKNINPVLFLFLIFHILKLKRTKQTGSNIFFLTNVLLMLSFFRYLRNTKNDNKVLIDSQLKKCSDNSFFSVKLLKLFDKINDFHQKTYFFILAISKINHKNRFSFLMYVLLLSGDISRNPGPTQNQNTEQPDSIWQPFQKRGLHMMHLNINSLLPKIDEIRNFV